VLRLSKVIDVKKEPWSNWIQDIKDGKAVFAFENYYLSPLAVSQASAAVLAVGSARSGGIWHASGLSSISYFEFLRLSKRLGTPSSVNAETRTSSRSHFVSGGSMDNSRIVNTGSSAHTTHALFDSGQAPARNSINDPHTSTRGRGLVGKRDSG
jgi:dTDP-4-dehydrorhamnose reductase